jgi:hypothetical protein
MRHRYDARLLLQSHRAPSGGEGSSAIELLFTGIEQLEMSHIGAVWDASGTIETTGTPGERQRVTMRFHGGFVVTAERLYFIDRPEWTGACSRFDAEVPAPDCVPAIPMVDDWRQCSSCDNAFQVPTEDVYVFCPHCGALTLMDTGTPKKTMNGSQT